MHLKTLFAIFSCLNVHGLCLWPASLDYKHGSSVCWLSPDFQLVHAGEGPKTWPKLQKLLRITSIKRRQENDDLIDAAFSRLQEDLHNHVFVPWKFHPRNEVFEPQNLSEGSVIRSITIKQHLNLLRDNGREAYELTVSEGCRPSIKANHPLGVVHALRTFTQLFYQHSQLPTGKPYMTTAPLKISDAPAFEHRGLNLDISRHIISPEDVMRTIDALAFCKFNRLHLHASDAQSWPLEIPSLPDLAAKGAYHKSSIWRVEDLYEVQRFGSRRGLEVYIEIDMPGHMASLQQSYPELLTSYNRKPWQKYSAQPPSGQLDLNSSATPQFIETLLSDLLPRTEPFSSLFHLGGDEITASAYNLTSTELEPYLQAFMDHAISIVKDHGLTPVVWEEHILDYNLSLPADTIIQTWRGPTPYSPNSSLAQIVSRGHRALFGSNDYWYLDCGHGTWLDPDWNNSDTRVKSPYLDYCSPLKNFRRILSYDPLADIPKNQRHLVLGGEVHLWGELTDGENLDAMLWPRAAATGEVLWRGKAKVGEESTRRLAEVREWLVRKGMRAEPVQVTWCLMNKGNCVA